MRWRPPPRPCDACQPLTIAGLRMSPESIQSFYALALGFAWAGFLATGYQAMTSGRRASGCCARAAPVGVCGGAVPGLRRAVHHHAQHAAGPPLRGRRFESVMVATLAAGIWSLMSGTVVVMAVGRAATAAIAPPLANPEPSWQGRAPQEECAHGDLRTRRPEARTAGRRPLLDRRNRDRDRARAAEDRRQRLVRLGAARRQRMDRARRALADPGQRHAAHRSRLPDRHRARLRDRPQRHPARLPRSATTA